MNKLLFDDMMGWFTLAIFFQVYHDYQTQCRTRKGSNFFFQKLTLGYITKTLNQIFFFPLPKSDYFFFPLPKSEYFFQQHWELEYFFRKKNILRKKNSERNKKPSS
jgi:hypothetical protein